MTALIDWVGFMAKDIEVLAKFRKLYKDKRASNECLWRDDEEGVCCTEQRAQGRRGRCMRHYRVFLRERLETPKSRRAAFEAQLIQIGQLEPDSQGMRNDLLPESAEAVHA